MARRCCNECAAALKAFPEAEQELGDGGTHIGGGIS